MGRAPCCDKANVKKGPWSPDEDRKLKDYIQTHGTGDNWITLPTKAGLRRCGKSCRLRWLNYLRPNIKHGEFSYDEEKVICNLFASIGSRWSVIAAQLPGRTDNDIKNYWNTKLKKKMMMNNLISMPEDRKPLHHLQSPNSSTNNYQAISFFPNSEFNISAPLSSSPSPPSSYTHVTNASDHRHYHPVLQSQDNESYQGVKDSSTLVVYGGDHASSSSNSDGSFHYVYGSATTGVHDCNNMDNWSFDSSLDSSLEEIKQLLDTNLCNRNIDNNLNFFSDDNKEVEKVMYY